MNYPQGNNSSGSDEEDQPSTGRREHHNNRHCKYERYQCIVNGRTVYAHLRICQCGMYTDRKEMSNRAFNLHETDGKEVHFNPACEWKRRTVVISGRRVYALNEHCACYRQSQTNSSVSSMNRVQMHY